MRKVIVIGAGAAGMMAAAAAAQNGCRVVLVEKNEKPGRKLFITGKGRCNLTNACKMEELFENVVTNPKFLYSAFYGFDNRRTMEWFEAAGCPLKTERGERVFPVSDHSSDVTGALVRQLKKQKVELRLGTAVTELVMAKEEAGSAVTGVRMADGTEEKADAVIVATGGLSYPLTGSTGDGYRLAEQAGHTVKPTFPALVPLVLQETWCRELQGLALKNVAVSFVQDGKKAFYEGFGEMLFTHFGVSGPLILSASSYYAGRKKKGDVKLHLDLKPALTAEQLDKRLLRDFEENKNKQFKNSLGGLFPSKLIPVMVRLSGIDGDKKVHEITKAERQRFAGLIKDVEMTVAGTRDYAEAVITRGGGHIKEVNPSTMESKKAKGLYFAGEVLDVDALTGGFNLQIAWSTGYEAGISAAGTESPVKK
jgi:flavoprotein, HI0933 family